MQHSGRQYLLDILYVAESYDREKLLAVRMVAATVRSLEMGNWLGRRDRPASDLLCKCVLESGLDDRKLANRTSDGPNQEGHQVPVPTRSGAHHSTGRHRKSVALKGRTRGSGEPSRAEPRIATESARSLSGQTLTLPTKAPRKEKEGENRRMRTEYWIKKIRGWVMVVASLVGKTN
ncbi:hypothetical protein B296_00022755 [Ensete ventricosum]|uniref:Uncharacterized protein n=1 Tax=Ensete ventricosum TaxID=4639 RepID=A0A426XS10_ENSVE|nr:hypothetical protein B296_00022755 [Ensete ventricosum]